MLTKTKGSETPHQGSGHWKLQRVSAVVLIPLTLWFMFAFINHIGDDHQTLSAWIGQPGIAVLLILYLGVLFFHAYLGIQVVVEDYVHSQGRLKVSLLLNKVILSIAGIVAIVSVLRIVL